MKRSSQFRPVLICQDNDGWMAVDASGRTIEYDSKSAETVSADDGLRSESDYQVTPGPVVVALCTSACFLARLDETAAAVTDLDELAYAVEDQLPIAAEDAIVARSDQTSTSSLTLVAQRQSIESAIEFCRHLRLFPTAITPAALLAVRAEAGPSDGCFVLEASENNELLALKSGELVEWIAVPAELELPVPDWFDPDVDKLSFVGSVQRLDEVRERIHTKSGTNPEIELVQDDFLHAMLAAAVRLNAGQERPLIDFRVGSFAPPSQIERQRPVIQVGLLALAIVVVMLGNACRVRSNSYTEWDSHYFELQQEAYRRVFPYGDLPLMLKTAMDTEKNQLQAKLENPRLVPDVHRLRLRLREFLGAVDAAATFHVESLELTTWKTRVTIRFRDKPAMEQLRSTLQQHGYKLEDEESTRLEDSITWAASLGESSGDNGILEDAPAAVDDSVNSNSDRQQSSSRRTVPQ